MHLKVRNPILLALYLYWNYWDVARIANATSGQSNMLDTPVPIQTLILSIFGPGQYLRTNGTVSMCLGFDGA